MKRTIALASILFVVVFCPLPATAYATSIPLNSGSYGQATISFGGGSSSGTFSATGSVTAFITNDSGHSGSPPVDALWTFTGTSGIWIVVFTGIGPWYLVFSNLNAYPVAVIYNIGGGEIPGFEYLFVFFALVSILGTFSLIIKFYKTL